MMLIAVVLALCIIVFSLESARSRTTHAGGVPAASKLDPVASEAPKGSTESIAVPTKGVPVAGAPVEEKSPPNVKYPEYLKGFAVRDYWAFEMCNPSSIPATEDEFATVSSLLDPYREQMRQSEEKVGDLAWDHAVEKIDKGMCEGVKAGKPIPNSPKGAKRVVITRFDISYPVDIYENEFADVDVLLRTENTIVGDAIRTVREYIDTL